MASDADKFGCLGLLVLPLTLAYFGIVKLIAYIKQLFTDDPSEPI